MNDLRVMVYSQESSLARPGLMVKEVVRDLFASRELAWQLAVRDIRAQYRQSALGWVWVFLLPLANTMAWLFMQSSGIISIQETTLPYPIYVFTGTILWSIFMDAVNAPLRQTTAAKEMLSKINFPRESLVLSGIYQTSFNAGVKILVLFAALLFLGVLPSPGLLLFPLAVISLIITGTALGLLVTPVGILYSDIGRGLPILLQFFMFVTPVVFPVPTSGWAATLFKINPLTPLILTARDLLTGQTPESFGAFILVSAVMLALLSVALLIYRAGMPILVERMSA